MGSGDPDGRLVVKIKGVLDLVALARAALREVAYMQGGALTLQQPSARRLKAEEGIRAAGGQRTRSEAKAWASAALALPTGAARRQARKLGSG
jgi:hypothetical protein